MADAPRRSTIAEHASAFDGLHDSPRMAAQRVQMRRSFGEAVAAPAVGPVVQREIGSGKDIGTEVVQVANGSAGKITKVLSNGSYEVTMDQSSSKVTANPSKDSRMLKSDWDAKVKAEDQAIDANPFAAINGKAFDRVVAKRVGTTFRMIKWWRSLPAYPGPNAELMISVEGADWALAHVKWSDGEDPKVVSPYMATLKSTANAPIPNGNFSGDGVVAVLPTIRAATAVTTWSTGQTDQMV